MHPSLLDAILFLFLSDFSFVYLRHACRPCRLRCPRCLIARITLVIHVARIALVARVARIALVVCVTLVACVARVTFDACVPCIPRSSAIVHCSIRFEDWTQQCVIPLPLSLSAAR